MFLRSSTHFQKSQIYAKDLHYMFFFHRFHTEELRENWKNHSDLARDVDLHKNLIYLPSIHGRMRL